MFDCISRVPIRPTSYFSLLYHHAGLYVGKIETFSLTDWIRWRYITFNSEDEIQWCDHLYEPSSLRSTLTWYYLLFYILQNKIWKFCRVLTLATQWLGQSRPKTTSHELRENWSVVNNWIENLRTSDRSFQVWRFYSGTVAWFWFAYTLEDKKFVFFFNLFFIRKCTFII